MAPTITLLTDFGLADTYVGQMKGAILAVNPAAVLVDLTHDVQPQQVEQGAFLLETATPAFPPGTIHLAVVDPGVGGDRRAIAVAAPWGTCVGPDNGLLSAALPDAIRPHRPGPVTLPTGVRAVELVERRYFRPVVSATFHGRDIFGPVAAHLSLGLPLGAFGPSVTAMHALPPFRARPAPDGSLAARIVSIDRFGNLITDCRAADLPSDHVVVTCRGRVIAGLAHTYAQAPAIAALIGSSGYLEIATPNGSAARALGAGIGDALRIEGSAGR